MSFSNEILRKIIHLSCLWIVVVYHNFGYDVIAKLLLVLLIICVICEWCRLRDNRLGELCRLFLDKTHLSAIMRKDEMTGFSGATKLIFTAYIMLYAISKNLYILAFSVLMISDAVAAVVGKKYGEIKIYGKSLEGSVAFLLSATAISFFWQYWLGETYTFLFVALVAAGLSTITELCSNKLNVDDNVLIPFIYALSSWIYDSMMMAYQLKPW